MRSAPASRIKSMYSLLSKPPPIIVQGQVRPGFVNFILVDHVGQKNPEWRQLSVLPGILDERFAPIVRSSNSGYRDHLLVSNSDLDELLPWKGPDSGLAHHESLASLCQRYAQDVAEAIAAVIDVVDHAFLGQLLERIPILDVVYSFADVQRRCLCDRIAHPFRYDFLRTTPGEIVGTRAGSEYGCHPSSRQPSRVDRGSLTHQRNGVDPIHFFTLFGWLSERHRLRKRYWIGDRSKRPTELRAASQRGQRGLVRVRLQILYAPAVIVEGEQRFALSLPQAVGERVWRIVVVLELNDFVGAAI